MLVARNFTIEGFRRTSERKGYQTEVSFSADTLCFPAMLENVSTGGALLSTKGLPILMPGTEIAVTIPFATKEGCLKRKAIVMWAKAGQFGIEFI
jgi:hypothetical protein